MIGLAAIVGVSACGGGEGPTGPSGGGPHDPGGGTPTVVVYINHRLPSLFVGDTTGLAATTTSTAGASVTAVLSWRSDNAAIASVSGSGIVTGVTAGTVWVVAETAGGSDSVPVAVLPVSTAHANRGFAYLADGGSAWIMPGDSTTAVEVIPAALNGQDIRWSPDGSHLATIHQASGADLTLGLYAMHGDGTSDGFIATDVVRPRWSPDGNRLAFRTYEGDIAVMDANGTNRHPLTSGLGDELNPEWSPDGRRIAYREGDCGGMSMMNSDGTNQHHVILPTTMCALAWSPDGKLIAYETQDGGVWLVNSDGTNPHPISGNCTNAGSCTGALWGHPVWSPDGKVVAISGAFGSTTAKLYTVSTQQTVEIMAGGARFEVLGWAPDHTRLGITFHDDYGNPTGIGTTALDGSDVVTLLSHGLDRQAVTQWRP